MLSTIDLSIWVAVMTGLALWLALLISIFWTIGTLSNGVSTPRSPLATIIPSTTSMISSIWSKASCFSILAITGMSAPFSRIMSFIILMSLASFTKESATRSIPCLIPNSKSSRSLSVKGGSLMLCVGRLIPL